MTIPADQTEQLDAAQHIADALPGVTQLTPYKDALRIPPVLHPTKLGAISIANVNMRAAKVRMHSELPPTRMWTYDEVCPGPTIVVRRGERVRISWTNHIEGSFPVTAVQAPQLSQLLEVGTSGAPPDPRVTDIVPWNVVHLHGALTGGDNDGWPENGVAPPDAQLSEYRNEQEATMLWYHDHAMAITRLTVLSGLAGMYLIRDDQEDALNLPRGGREIPLMLSDHNLVTNPDGTLTGRILHKVALADANTGLTTVHVGPFNVVNGVITPHLDVSAAWYRFRIVNASNGRTYLLRLFDEANVVTGAIKQIGTDGGLLPAPITLDDLKLAPAERADILINFAAFKGKRLQLRNIGPRALDATHGDPVMELRVSSFPAVDPFVLPTTLSKTYQRYGHDNGTIPKDHQHRWVVLTPVALGHPEIWEMEEVCPDEIDPGETGIVQVVDVKKDAAGNEVLRQIKTLRRVASRFSDTLSFRVNEGDFEVWNFIHVGGVGQLPPTQQNPMHPLHIHLVQFQALRRIAGAVLEADQKTPVFDDHQVEVNGALTTVRGTRHPIDFVRSGASDEGLAQNETGWKDVIRVDPGTWVQVAAKFAGAHGRFVYHCHLLDHEDEGMMRPFVVMPRQVAALDVEHGGGHGHDHLVGHTGFPTMGIELPIAP